MVYIYLTNDRRSVYKLWPSVFCKYLYWCRCPQITMFFMGYTNDRKLVLNYHLPFLINIFINASILIIYWTNERSSVLNYMKFTTGLYSIIFGVWSNIYINASFHKITMLLIDWTNDRDSDSKLPLFFTLFNCPWSKIFRPEALSPHFFGWKYQYNAFTMVSLLKGGIEDELKWAHWPAPEQQLHLRGNERVDWARSSVPRFTWDEAAQDGCCGVRAW